MDGNIVAEAVTRLKQQGIPVTVRSVHRVTGGSFRDITRILQALPVDQPTPASTEPALGPADHARIAFVHLQAILAQLATTSPTATLFVWRCLTEVSTLADALQSQRE